MEFICDCADLHFKTVEELIEHVEKEHRSDRNRTPSPESPQSGQEGGGE